VTDPSARRPIIRALSQHACLALLARNHVGRLAFALHDRVDIQPLHYVYEAGWIYGRTSEGAKLTALAHHQWVAFEVDEVHGAFEWTSVVVQGSFHRIDAGSPVPDAAAEAHAVRLLRTIVPETFTLEDPVPFRTVVFRVALGETTGRTATTAA
jgi:nitroimidazol reductase NimA-like FMN-containing flavoprotein (pyridoxamine 5'-phosphate oxidase superfamily)